ncbi:MAG: DEAD/DEAH box helicase [Planctomycetaceae bacterium]
MKTTLFTDLPLGRELQQALRDADHVTPTPIQAAAIPVVLEGRDLLGCAQTGTGKTAAFALPILQQLHDSKLKTTPKSPFVLVLVPTRELAAQVMESFSRYGKQLRFWQAAIYGGVNQNPQVSALRRGVHVLVATPGRLLDLMGQGHVRLDQVRTLVLDEADRMLDMGFLPPLRKIIGQLPEQRQSLCFSATMPKEIADLVHDLLRDPQRIDIAPPSSTAKSVEQQVLQVEQLNKRDMLQQILKQGDAYRVLVFTRTKKRADVVARQLRQADIEADAIHGDKSQAARTKALEKFKKGRIHVLVATDVAARGIDVEGISHVINYDLPHDPESYVHRIGRTGRASAVGKAITFCDPSERGLLRAVERLIGIDLLPREERRDRRPRAEGESRPQRGGRPQGGRRPQKGRSQGGRPYGGRPQGERPQYVRAEASRPEGEQAQGEQSGEERRRRYSEGSSTEQQAPRSYTRPYKAGGRPQGNRPQGGRPQGGGRGRYSEQGEGGQGEQSSRPRKRPYKPGARPQGERSGEGHRSRYSEGGQAEQGSRPPKRKFKSGGRPQGRPAQAQSGEGGVAVSEDRRPAGQGARRPQKKKFRRPVTSK